MKTIEFTDNELQILIQLLDISVKAQGLNDFIVITVLFLLSSIVIDKRPGVIYSFFIIPFGLFVVYCFNYFILFILSFFNIRATKY